MVRIYLVLALIAVCLLAGNLVLGFVGGDVAGTFKGLTSARENFHALKAELDNADPKLQAAAEELSRLEDAATPIFERLHLHRLLGILAVLVTVLVNSISVTYFIGTGRWCKEVVAAYSLDTHFIETVTRLKRKSFPWAMTSILLALALVAMGAICDPSANPSGHDVWVLPHLMCAILATAVITWSFLVQVGNIGANFETINQILDNVWKIRDARGMDKEQKSEVSDEKSDVGDEESEEADGGEGDKLLP